MGFEFDDDNCQLLINRIASQPIVIEKNNRRLNLIVGKKLNKVSFNKIWELCSVSDKRIILNLDELDLNTIIDRSESAQR